MQDQKYLIKKADLLQNSVHIHFNASRSPPQAAVYDKELSILPACAMLVYSVGSTTCNLAKCRTPC